MIRSATAIAAALLAACAAQAAQAQVVLYSSPMTTPPAAVVVAPVAPTMTAAPTATVAAPVIYAPGTAPGVRSFYQVKQGGRLQDVARRVRVSLADLVRLNPHLSPRAWLPAGTLVGLPVS